MSTLTLDRSGTDRIQRIADELSRHPNFWERVGSSLDEFGFSDRFVEDFVQPDASSVRYIKDSVWGMMQFSSEDVSLIDSPIVQRLRRVKQLGFSNLVYPSAEHSRFAHSLGVAHVVQQFINSIADVHRRQPYFTIAGREYQTFSAADNSEIATSLVHAGLLHDAGHLGFSHASEAALNAQIARITVGGMPAQDLIDLFREQEIKSDLSEILSVVICLSPRFKTFYNKVLRKNDSQPDLLRICSFITGTPHHNEYQGLANLISGSSVDADKIDYINRDARSCGIPTSIDVSRIFLNTSLVRIDKDEAARLSGRKASDTTSRTGYVIAPGVHFLVNSSGIDTYDEIAISKSVLYHRVYLHHATRNIEQLLLAAFAILCRRPARSRKPFLDVLSLLPFGDERLLDELAKESSIRPIVARIRNRKLPKRAISLFRDICEPNVVPSDIFAEGTSRGDGVSLPERDAEVRRLSSWRVWDRLVPSDHSHAAVALERIRSRIRDRALEVRAILEPSFDRTTVPSGEPYVGFAPRVMLKTVKEVIVREKNALNRSSQWTKSEELTTAENVFRAADWVFADSEWLDAVRISTLCVVHESGKGLSAGSVNDTPSFSGQDCGEIIAPSTIPVASTIGFSLEDLSSRLGINYDRFVEQMRQVGKAGYFGDAYRLVPLSQEQESHCGAVAYRFRHFAGERGWIVTARSCSAFVRQFPVALRDEMIALLAQVEMPDRNDYASGGLRLLGKMAAGAAPILIGRFSPNSGSYMGMLFEQDFRDSLSAKGHAIFRSIGELEGALENAPGSQILFLDDQIASGGQATAQLYFWSGLEREAWPEEVRAEQNIDLTSPGGAFRQALATNTIRLGFLYGRPEGTKRISDASHALGYPNIEATYLSPIPAAKNLSSELESFLSATGEALLRQARNVSDTQAAVGVECKRDSLGYDGAASCLVTPANVPTHTITALWCPGYLGSLPWIPLFIRRGYRKHLVLG